VEESEIPDEIPDRGCSEIPDRGCSKEKGERAAANIAHFNP
jgi:hypothetical protein